MATPFIDYTGDLTGSIGQIVGSTTSLLIKIILAVLGVVGVGALIWWKKVRGMYNIPITIFIPRSDGKIIDEISARGGYFKTMQKEGGQVTTFRLKRKGQKTIDMPPPHSRFLVGLSRKLYLIQKGVDDFEPVLPDSFRFVTTEEGKKISIINLKCINQDATAWVEDNRENAKRRFTFHGFWEKYKDFIQMTIFIFIVMLAIYINWQSMKDVVAGLQNVANTLSTKGVTVKG